MKRLLTLCSLLAVVGAARAVPQAGTGAPAAAQSSSVAASPEQYRATVTTYCTGCHNARAKTGGLALDAMNFDAVANDAVVWEKVVRKLRGRLMPPPGAKQPSQQEVDTLVGWLEGRLDSAPQGPKTGHVPIQRLDRTEYAASVKALLGVDINVKDVLPQDVEVEGFDNIASALTVSPAFVDQYVSAARLIARQAVGGPVLDDVKYTLAANRNPEGMPLGLRDGMMFKHNFPADGEYRINILFPDQTVGLYTGTLENESTVVIMVDGKIMFKKPIGGLADLTLNNRKAGDGRALIMERFTKIPIQVQAGVRTIVVGFVERSRFESTDAFSGGGRSGYPGLGDVEILGPYNSTGVSSPSRALIYVCNPKTAGEAVCAKQIAENLAKRAFRRPVTEADTTRLMPFYEAGRKDGGSFDQGVERLVTSVLASPDFLYRAIRTPETTKEGALSDLELASRLSFFLWNTGPDKELLDLAATKSLSRPATFDAQVKRMLGDPKASSLVSSFSMKWLGLNSLDSVKPDPAVFPGFNEQLRKDFLMEAELFIGSILLEDRSIIDLMTADHTFVNDRLARHYGIQGITGNQFRRVTLEDKNRFGLLGKAAVLMKTSYGNRTSPVLRGAWILDRLMGTPPSPPPPSVESNLAEPSAEQPKTVRARLEQHRDKPLCRQCHGVIDPTGLALENFDSIGQFRTVDRQAVNAPIDASSVLPNGVAINGPVEMREQLAGRPAMFAQTFTEKLMMYGINRELEYYDMPQVRGIVHNAAKDNYKLSSIVLGIVHSDAFRKQGPIPKGKEVAAK
jgi:mono/diheme cytochrome c family protein